MAETDDCLIIINCNHSFHRSCIENFLSNTSECPICKRPCELADLKKINISVRQNPVAKPGVRNRGRGALAKQYNTRSQARNLFQDSQRSLLENSNMINDQEEVSTPGRVIRQSPHNSPNQNNPVNVTRVTIDYIEYNSSIN